MESLLTYAEQAELALRISNEYGQKLDLPLVEISQASIDHWTPIVQQLSMEAGNPNALMMMAKSHDEQLAVKLRDGWRYGPILDIDQKIHPELLPFSQLPKAYQARALLFRTVITSLVPFSAGY